MTMALVENRTGCHFSWNCSLKRNSRANDTDGSYCCGSGIILYDLNMNNKPNLSESEAVKVARGAYQTNGSFGTSPVAWGISNIVLDPRYHAVSITAGLLVMGFAYFVLLGVFNAIAYVLIAAGALLIGRSILQINAQYSDEEVPFRQVTLFPDRMLLLPKRLSVSYSSLDYIRYSVREFRSERSNIPTGDMHTFIVSVAGNQYRCVWYGPALPLTVFDYDLDKLLFYLGFREGDDFLFKYAPSLAPTPDASFVPVVPSVMARNMSPLAIAASSVLVGGMLYLLWTQVAARAMQ